MSGAGKQSFRLVVDAPFGIPAAVAHISIS